MFEKNCLSYWFPKLLEAALPVPQTAIVRMTPEAHRGVLQVLDGKTFSGDAHGFFDALRGAIHDIGLPCFLRTGQTSGKHQWKDTCYLKELDDLERHVLALMEFSECCGMIGLPCDVWAVRELLPTEPLMVCDRYGGMPVCREFRCFVRDSRLICSHPYWPVRALVEGGAKWTADAYNALCDAGTAGELNSIVEAHRLAKRAGAALGGEWSVDVLWTYRGWYVTDCAVAGDSWHWEDCPHAAEFQRSEL